MKLRTDLSDRAAWSTYLTEALDGLYTGTADPAPTVGGRRAALVHLQAFDPTEYARTRNDVLRRGVSALSAYIRHAVLRLAEVRDDLIARFGSGSGVQKFVNELAWRACWQLVYAGLGERIRPERKPRRPGPVRLR
ncbi:MAG: hypothetical protein HC822_09430 [Oscillochloris sp.]|nr:hypothetical protein [Oscillochloris sp.]